ncbi:hypothetical protein LZ190_20995, partial [Rhodovulum sulfidophilum]|nr:hypothetical protein [Rhodovulum sulfidophilum]
SFSVLDFQRIRGPSPCARSAVHEDQALRKRKRAPSGARLEVGAKIARVSLAKLEAENGPGKRGLSSRMKR